MQFYADKIDTINFIDHLKILADYFLWERAPIIQII